MIFIVIFEYNYFFKEKKVQKIPQVMESSSISVDLSLQISFNLILNPEQGRGPGSSDFEIQGFFLLLLRQMLCSQGSFSPVEAYTPHT